MLSEKVGPLFIVKTTSFDLWSKTKSVFSEEVQNMNKKEKDHGGSFKMGDIINLNQAELESRKLKFQSAEPEKGVPKERYEVVLERRIPFTTIIEASSAIEAQAIAKLHMEKLEWAEGPSQEEIFVWPALLNKK